jgi:hypothetical protein
MTQRIPLERILDEQLAQAVKDGRTLPEAAEEWSPISRACNVESTISVNRMVASMRRDSAVLCVSVPGCVMKFTTKSAICTALSPSQ